MQVKSTRSELLRLKRKGALASKGHDLLKKKQDSLMLEFFRLLKEVRSARGDLQERYSRAQRMINRARAVESDLDIKAAALCVPQVAPFRVEVKQLAGVKIPTIVIEREQPELPLFDSIMLQEVGEAYRKVIEGILQLAARETALRKVLLEIRKTKRRSQALENVLIPRLESAAKRVMLELEERSREEFSRLKRRKRR